MQTIDIAPLLGTKDLDRAWVAENLGLIVTISNLRGIPYSVDRTGNNFEERIGYHADQVEFVVNANGESASQTALVLGYPDQPKENWDALRTAAMATGAFPVALRARIVQKKKNILRAEAVACSQREPVERRKLQRSAIDRARME